MVFEEVRHEDPIAASHLSGGRDLVVYCGRLLVFYEGDVAWGWVIHCFWYLFSLVGFVSGEIGETLLHFRRCPLFQWLSDHFNNSRDSLLNLCYFDSGYCFHPTVKDSVSSPE
jgi:hypothetical protein